MKNLSYLDVIRDLGEGSTKEEVEAVILYTQSVNSDLHYMGNL